MNYKEFYSDNQKWISSALWLFGLSIIAGAAAAFYYPDLMDSISRGFEERFAETPHLNGHLAREIFQQNVTASLIAWIGGLLIGLAPVFAIILNGFILGYVAAYIMISSGAIFGSIIFLIIGLVPHAIFEIPAFLMAAVLGMNLGLNWIAPQAKGKRWEVFKDSVQHTSYYFIVVIVLLSIAAGVEVFVSGKLLEKLQ